MRFEHNFSGGPGTLPRQVLEQTRDSLMDVPEVGLPLLGISHRSSWFREVVREAEDHFRFLLKCPDDYHILFLQGGGTQQFSQVPMTLLRDSGLSADYLHTGYWSGKSIPEARREGEVCVVWSGEGNGFRKLPRDDALNLSPDAAYFHYISNETVEGTQFNRVIGREDVVRVCDMSSDFTSRPIDVERFGIIYAHAQKNLGPAGFTVVVVRDQIVQACPEGLPSALDYRRHAEAGSIYNTPPVFAIYVTMLVARWLRNEIGSLESMAEINERKSQRLYRVIDDSDGFFAGRADPGDRSRMNVVFSLPNASLEEHFLAEAARAGICGLEGHRSIGGLRASLYNAVSLESVDALADLMETFLAQHKGVLR